LEDQKDTMTEREKILARIREALTVPAVLPGTHGVATLGAVGTPRPTSAAPSVAAPLDPRPWLPLVGETFDARVALFQKNSADLKTTIHVLNNDHELAKALCALRDTEGWKKIGTHSGELTDETARVLNLPLCRTDESYKVNELESCDAGITECDALIAQTGSVLVTARSAGGRALSVLPPHHVVLARRKQLVPDLTEAFAVLKEKYAPNYPSFISFITGPSRTGDIERILVLGAHGPKKLTIFLL
jgi:L-lactate dehydrogenase complex protein LldG